MSTKMGLSGIPDFVVSPEKSRRLSAIAAWINARTEVLLIRAELHKTRVSTDRTLPKGLRFRIHTGKGRTGNELRVYATAPLTVSTPFGPSQHAPGALVRSHNAAETYRSNEDVERWLRDFVQDMTPSKKRQLRALSKRLETKP